MFPLKILSLPFLTLHFFRIDYRIAYLDFVGTPLG